eukprot:scaffold38782_cov38-Prasinocladus_malaysianus.AAC.1
MYLFQGLDRESVMIPSYSVRGRGGSVRRTTTTTGLMTWRLGCRPDEALRLPSGRTRRTPRPPPGRSRPGPVLRHGAATTETHRAWRCRRGNLGFPGH